MLKPLLVGMTSLLWLAACDPRLDLGTPDAGDAVVADAGIPEGGFASLTGTAAFEVKSSRVFVEKRPDGSLNLPTLGVALSDVDLGCTAPNWSTPGFSKVISLFNKGVALEGRFPSDGNNMYFRRYPSDAGPGRIDLVAANAGEFTLQPEADITQGLRGSLNATFSDGTTVSGTFSASFCTYTP